MSKFTIMRLLLIPINIRTYVNTYLCIFCTINFTLNMFDFGLLMQGKEIKKKSYSLAKTGNEIIN